MTIFDAGGYVLVQAANPGWPQLQADGLTGALISLSPCLCPRLDLQWGHDSSDAITEQLTMFGMPAAQQTEFRAWCAAQAYRDQIAWPDVFLSVEAARQFVRQFAIDPAGKHIVGIGWPRELAANSDLSMGAMATMAARREPLESGGTLLGYEVISFVHGTPGHSWLCNGINRDMHELYGIRPNARGLIADYVETRRVLGWIAADDQQGIRAEPEPYVTFRLESY